MRMKFGTGILVILLMAGSLSAQWQERLFPLPKGKMSVENVELQPHMNAESAADTKDLRTRNRGRATLSSLLLPGSGERLLGADTRGAIFTGTEVALWLSYIGFSLYSQWREDDYQAYAAEHAGIHPGGKSSQYWIDIGTHDNLNVFNEGRLRDRAIEEVYPDRPEYRWDWENYDHRLRYDEMRLESRRTAKLASFTIGAIIVNHLASALDVTYLYNTRIRVDAEQVSYQIEIPLH